MKKLQIMAGMLSVLLLAGCGGAGASAKTTEGDPPQVALPPLPGPQRRKMETKTLRRS